VGGDSLHRAGAGRLTPVLPLVILCIALHAVEQVWVEWKRLLWGELAMAVREKIVLTMRRALAARTH
jgi:hypothetical protein